MICDCTVQVGTVVLGVTYVSEAEKKALKKLEKAIDGSKCETK